MRRFWRGPPILLWVCCSRRTCGRLNRTPWPDSDYGDHADFDDYINRDYGPFEVLEAPLTASEALYRTDF